MAVTALAALILSACGGSSDSSSSGTSTSGGGSDGVERSQDLLTEYSKIPSFEPPGPPIDAVAGMKGKKVMSIPVTSEIPLIQTIEEAMEEQAKEIGFKFTHWANQGKSDQWVQGVETAIAQNYDVIDLFGLDPSLLKPQVEAARKAGIKVTSTHLSGFETPVPPYIDGAVRLPYYEAGRIVAAYPIVQQEGDVNALAIVAEDQLSTKDFIKGMKDEFAENCPGCKLKTVNVPAPQWATGVQREVASSLQADPNVNWVIPSYDAMVQYAIAGLRVAGKAGTMGMSTFNGSPFALELVASGDLDMDLGENEVWISRAMLDADMRAAMGKPIPDNDYEAAPLLVFTADNVATAGDPPNPAKGYGDAWEAGFEELWGLK